MLSWLVSLELLDLLGVFHSYVEHGHKDRAFSGCEALDEGKHEVPEVFPFTGLGECEPVWWLSLPFSAEWRIP